MEGRAKSAWSIMELEGDWQLLKLVGLCVLCVRVCKVDRGGIYRDYLTYCY